MRNILILAGLAGLAAAVAIYFTNDTYLDDTDSDYITDIDIEEYDIRENTGVPRSV